MTSLGLLLILQVTSIEPTTAPQSLAPPANAGTSVALDLPGQPVGQRRGAARGELTCETVGETGSRVRRERVCRDANYHREIRRAWDYQVNRLNRGG